MTRRRNAYFNALKCYFSCAIVEDGRSDFRAIYAEAKAVAARYAFNASTDHLTFVSL